MPALANRDDASIESLRRDLRRGKPDPIYLVEGEEPLLVDEAVRVIVEAVLAPDARDFNLGTFSGDDEAVREFLAQARSYPFLAERRVVVVRRFERLSLRDRDEAAFMEYLKEPAPTTVLVLVAAKLDRRTNVSKAVERAARAVAAAPVGERELPAWTRARVAARGLEIDDAACQRLVELAGPALLDIANEIDKIWARYPQSKRVEVAHVDATVGTHRLESVFAVNRAFRPDDLPGFLRALARVLEIEGDDDAIRVGAVLARHVNDLLRVRLMLDRGASGAGTIAGRLRRAPWQIEPLLPQARAWTGEQLRLCLRNLQRADRQMKSHALPKSWTLQRALVHSFMGRELV
jgi:DNA polymerase-3 subunit delta